MQGLTSTLARSFLGSGAPVPQEHVVFGHGPALPVCQAGLGSDQNGLSASMSQCSQGWKCGPVQCCASFSMPSVHY